MANELLKGVVKLVGAIVLGGTAVELGNKAKKDHDNYKKLNQNNNAQ